MNTDIEKFHHIICKLVDDYDRRVSDHIFTLYLTKHGISTNGVMSKNTRAVYVKMAEQWVGGLIRQFCKLFLEQIGGNYEQVAYTHFPELAEKMVNDYVNENELVQLSMDAMSIRAAVFGRPWREIASVIHSLPRLSYSRTVSKLPLGRLTDYGCLLYVQAFAAVFMPDLALYDQDISKHEVFSENNIFWSPYEALVAALAYGYVDTEKRRMTTTLQHMIGGNAHGDVYRLCGKLTINNASCPAVLTPRGSD